MERLVDELIDFRDRSFGFGVVFDGAAELGDELEMLHLGADFGVIIADEDFEEQMEIGPAAAAKGKIGFVEQVEAAAERRIGPVSTFGDGGDAAEIRSDPMDDQAGFGEGAGSEDDSGCALMNHGEGRGRADGCPSLGRGNRAASSERIRFS